MYRIKHEHRSPSSTSITTKNFRAPHILHFHNVATGSLFPFMALVRVWDNNAAGNPASTLVNSHHSLILIPHREILQWHNCCAGAESKSHRENTHSTRLYLTHPSPSRARWRQIAQKPLRCLVLFPRHRSGERVVTLLGDGSNQK